MYSTGYTVQTPESGRNPRRRRRNPENNSEEILCSVCDIWVVGVPQYQAHVDGGKHQRRAKERAADQVVERMPFMKLDEESGMYTCTVCNVLLNSSLVVMMHVSGLRHKESMDVYEEERKEVVTYGKKEERKEVESDGNNRAKTSSGGSVSNGTPNTAKSSSYPPSKKEEEDIERQLLENVAKKLTPVNLRDSVISPSVYECTVCDIRTNSESQLQQHKLSAKHKNRLAAKPDIPPPSKPGEGFKQLQCKTCNVWVNSQVQMDQHMASEKHKSVSDKHKPALPAQSLPRYAVPRYTPYPMRRP